MGLNDESEKLRQAARWLEDCDASSQHSRAAWEHVTHVLTTTADPALRAQAQKIADQVILGRTE
jgi:hypothetical protein